MMTTIATSDSDLVQTGLVSAAAPAPKSALRPAPQPEASIEKADVLVQLRSNLNQLEDLHGRLRYVMTEISGLLRK